MQVDKPSFFYYLYILSSPTLFWRVVSNLVATVATIFARIYTYIQIPKLTYNFTK